MFYVKYHSNKLHNGCVVKGKVPNRHLDSINQHGICSFVDFEVERILQSRAKTGVEDLAPCLILLRPLVYRPLSFWQRCGFENYINCAITACPLWINAVLFSGRKKVIYINLINQKWNPKFYRKYVLVVNWSCCIACLNSLLVNFPGHTYFNEHWVTFIV